MWKLFLVSAISLVKGNTDPMMIALTNENVCPLDFWDAFKRNANQFKSQPNKEKRDCHVRFVSKEIADRLVGDPSGVSSQLAKWMLNALPLETLEFAKLLDGGNSWTDLKRYDSACVAGSFTLLDADAAVSDSAGTKNYLLPLVMYFRRRAKCDAEAYERSDMEEITSVTLEKFREAYTILKLDPYTRTLPGDEAFLNFLADETTKFQEVSDFSNLASQIRERNPSQITEIRFIPNELAAKLVRLVDYPANSEKVNPNPLDNIRRRFLAQSLLLSLPLATLKFARLLKDSTHYEDCPEAKLAPLTNSGANFLVSLVEYLYAVAHCPDTQGGIPWNHPNKAEIDRVTIAEFSPDGKYVGKSDGKLDQDNLDTHEKVVNKNQPIATSHTDAASDIASILTNESNMAAKLSAVAITMSALGRTSVHAAANVQILNTYIDLVQRAMTQLSAIDAAITHVSDAQELVTNQIKKTLQL